MKYFLQLASVSMWELVDETTYKNATKVVNKDGSPRYREGSVTIDGNKVSIHGEYTLEELAVITRFIGAEGKAPPRATVAQAFYVEPEFLRFRTKNGIKVHEVKRAA